MPIKIVRGDLFESGADALINPCNCVGTLGKGLALQFKKRFPEMVSDYVSACKKKVVCTGKVWVWMNIDEVHEKTIIINFPTKEHWLNPSELEWIETGLDDLREKLSSFHEQGLLNSVAVPALGCGLVV